MAEVSSSIDTVEAWVRCYEDGISPGELKDAPLCPRARNMSKFTFVLLG
jgi:hypothetical protein